jgi:hypothetical protein
MNFAFRALFYSFVTRAFFIVTGKSTLPSPVSRIISSIETILLRLQGPASNFCWIRLTSLATYKILRSLYPILLASNDLYFSKFWEVGQNSSLSRIKISSHPNNTVLLLKITWLSIALAWGTIRIFVTRQGVYMVDYGYSGNGVLKLVFLTSADLQEQNIWGFGQVVALVLLLVPILSFLGSYFRVHLSTKSH